MDFWIKAAQLILSLSILVVLHEFGHYLTARMFKIRVEKFYLFFNPWFSLFKKKIGDTVWGIGWLPLGGYVKIAGMIDESMDKEQMAQEPKPWEFRSKPAWQRLIVMTGGVIVNIITGVVIYIFVFYAWGEEKAPTRELTAGLTIHPYLEKYDLHSGDNILKVNGEEVMHYNDINNALLLRDQRELTVKRPTGETEIITLPEGIEYELFHEGALPAVGMRHPSTVVNHVLTVDEVSGAGIQKSDFISAINGTAISEVDVTSEAFLNENQFKVELLREGTMLHVDLTADQMQQLLRVAPAMAGGLKSKDQILRINGREIAYFDEVVAALYHSKNEKVNVDVLRKGDTLSLPVMVSSMGSIGFSPVQTQEIDGHIRERVHYSFGASIGKGIARGYTTLSDYVSQLKFLFTKKGAGSIGGFGAIGSMFPAAWNWQIFWLNTALISIILAFMNILPIPALDGGHVVFLLYEMITGKEAPQKVLEYAQYIGFFLLMALVLYANLNDIYRWLFGA